MGTSAHRGPWTDRVAEMVMLSDGWRRSAALFLSGALGALALPPFGLLPFAAAPMAAAVWTLDSSGSNLRRSQTSISRRLRRVFADGWLIGFGYFLAGLWWIGAAFLVEADRFAWALPFGVTALPAVLALFAGAGLALAKLFWSTSPLRVFVLAAALGLTEWLRGFVFTGFPWNSFGMALGGHTTLAQVASVVGQDGLNMIAVALAAMPAVFLTEKDKKIRRRLLAVFLGGITSIYAFGAIRLAAHPTQNDAAVRLRVLQPNLRQDEKFRPDRMSEIVNSYISMSSRPSAAYPRGLEDVTHLVWPESPFPVVLTRDLGNLERIAQSLPVGITLLTGAVREEEKGRRSAFFNSIIQISRGGLSNRWYDKAHLVPFGEYVPFARLVEWSGLRQFVHIPGGFSQSASRRALEVAGLGLVAPIICYEAIFSGSVVPVGTERPRVILNLTNDGWFGSTPGPYQHLALARLRAVEEGLPLVRSANTGVSAVIDPLGRSIGETPLGRAGVLDVALPAALPSTWFSRTGFLTIGLLWAAMAGLGLIGAIRKRNLSVI